MNYFIIIISIGITVCIVFAHIFVSIVRIHFFIS